MNTVDNDMVRELTLYAQNDSTIYESVHMPYVRNFQGKIRKGVFNKDLAIKDIRSYYVNLVVSRYNEDLGPISQPDEDTKDALAKEILDLILQDINDLKTKEPEI
jgi:hypothetical protein